MNDKLGVKTGYFFVTNVLDVCFADLDKWRPTIILWLGDSRAREGAGLSARTVTYGANKTLINVDLMTGCLIWTGMC